MYHSGLWKYCTKEQCQEMLLSFHLLGNTDWTDEKVTACLYAVSNHAESHYHIAEVFKRDKTKRRLLVPDALLKRIQRNILHHILDGFSVSPYAAAYQRGKTVVSNASFHVGKEVVFKLDIKDFFGSITFPMVLKSAFPYRYFPPAVGTMLTALCCYRDYLPQGAPTSAAISNLVMKPFDEYMGKWCEKRSVTYSRYCDDMTFSGDFDVRLLERKAENFLKTMGFELNRSKTKRLTCHNRQTVTGIVVNEKTQVPRDYKKKIRQELYYCETYGVEAHLGWTGKETEQNEDERRRYLLGVLGRIDYALQVNPEDTWFLEAKERGKKLLYIQAGNEEKHHA